MTIPLNPLSRTKILANIDNHGCFARHYEDLYFLAAADLNEHLEPGSTWDDPKAQVRAAVRVIALVEIEPNATTARGSLRLQDRDEYRRYRRQLQRMLKLARRLAHWPTTVQAMLQARLEAEAT